MREKTNFRCRTSSNFGHASGIKDWRFLLSFKPRHRFRAADVSRSDVELLHSGFELLLIPSEVSGYCVVEEEEVLLHDLNLSKWIGG